VKRFVLALRVRWIGIDLVVRIIID